jgi:hypothetical protein
MGRRQFGFVAAGPGHSRKYLRRNCEQLVYISETLHLKSGTDEHLRAILEYFDLKRLTAQVGTTLLEILDRTEASPTPLFDKLASS